MAKKISSLHVVLGGTIKPFVSAFQGAKSTLTGFVSSIKSASSTIVKFTGIAGGIGAVFGALKGAASGITLAAQLEQVGVAFETMLGSGQAAKALMDQLTQFSSQTPFEFPEIASSAKKLLAFGVGAGDMTNKLRMLGDIAAGAGAPLEEIASIYGKVKSRGQLTGETLNQLAEKGIPIYSALAQTMGVAETQVAGLVSAGKVGFVQVDAALGSLTKTGGQFAGMMDKQSQTMAGLWSTLTDNIGLSLAGLVTSMVDAFSLRDAMKALSGAIGNIGGWLNSVTATYAPVIVAGLKAVGSAIANTFSSIYEFIAPIVGAYYDVVSRNWQAILQSTIGFGLGVWNAVSSAFVAVWQFVGAVGEYVATAWNWAMNAMGVQTADTGTTIGDIFQSLVDWGRWLADGITTPMNTIAYLFAHWQDVVDLAATNVLLGVVRIGNQIAYTFTEAIPALLNWFAGNWRDIFTSMWNYTTTVFTNMAKNIGGFFAAVWSALKGGGFNFEWTGLLDGFESTLKELPKIADRQIGPLEQALSDRAASLSTSLGVGLGEYLAKQQQAAKDATKSLRGGLEIPKPPALEAPTMPPVKVNVDSSEIDDISQAATKASADLKALFSNSAESQKARFEAIFDARAQGVDGMGGANAAAPLPAPVPANATRAMREKNDVAGLLREILALDKDRNRYLSDIADNDGGMTLAEADF
jgi:tape measure domain-containing protein